MTKRPSLFAAKAAKPAAAAEVDTEAVEIAPVSETKASTPRTKTRPPSREGKRVLSVYLKPEAWKQLRMLSVNLESPTQALGEEAINLLFEKHRLNRIA
jgi:hypothetical protein